MRLLPLLCCAALCLPGRAVRGPGTVEGYIGGSLSVSCSYQKGYEKYPKYWCYPGMIKSCSYNTHLVITSEQQPWAQRGRTSIWDNRTARVFTVTVRDLTAGDAGTYRCGVRTRLLQMDVADKVRVTVLPGPTSASPSTSAITPGSILGPTCTPSQQETAEQTARPTSSGDLSEGHPRRSIHRDGQHSWHSRRGGAAVRGYQPRGHGAEPSVQQRQGCPCIPTGSHRIFRGQEAVAGFKREYREPLCTGVQNPSRGAGTALCQHGSQAAACSTVRMGSQHCCLLGAAWDAETHSGASGQCVGQPGTGCMSELLLS
ncbi:CMRF35-like molecule 2 isoform X3 [Lagopus muta]|uniref:CMRF35-like molecule 2 isoform X3 n=1 Tax=Lagopus muta TaxID=64668 RepID=UPI0020A1BB24|nr:CMRF35-like molecule 2 isoform X3 [Lagopus muta]